MDLSEVFIVQSFTRSTRGGVSPDAPMQVGSVAHARKIVDRISPEKVCVVAIAASSSELFLVAGAGEVPEHIADLPAYE